MADKKRIRDYFRKVELGDLKVLIIGLILLIVPVIVIISMVGNSSTEDLSRDHLMHMATRGSDFNFHDSNIGVGNVRAPHTTSGWFSDASPEKQTELQLEDAMKSIQRSAVARVSRFENSSDKRLQEYGAEIDPDICNANGALDQGRLLEAEQYFSNAFKRGDSNIFLKLHAIAGLCEVYSRMKDKKKLEKAFQIYMNMVAQLPADMGGGNLRASVKNAYFMLKNLTNKSDPSKLTSGLLKCRLARSEGVNASIYKNGAKQMLNSFPAKF